MLGGWTPAFGEGPQPAVVFWGLAREHWTCSEQTEPLGSALAREGLLEEGTYENLLGWPLEILSATAPSLSSHTDSR